MLYRVLAEHLETFLWRTSADESRGNLPRFVESELRAFLDCGLLQRILPRAGSAAAAATRGPSCCEGCPECGGRRKLWTFLTDPRTIARILEHLGLPQSLPEIAPARAPPEAELPLPSC